MGFQLDTSGAVAMGSEHGPQYAGINLVWSDLTPFAQGFVEALFAPHNHGRSGRSVMTVGGRQAAFRDLAPETLARIIAVRDRVANYEIFSILASGWDNPQLGALVWAEQQRGAYFDKGFPPLTVTLGDDGKVRFKEYAPARSEGTQPKAKSPQTTPKGADRG